MAYSSFTVIQSYLAEEPGGMICVGVGNGSECYEFSRAYPDSSLLAFEPHPKWFKSHLPRFPGLLLNYAVSNEYGFRPFYLRPGNHQASSLFKREQKTDPVIDVPVVTLDGITEHLREIKNSILWMDCEGAELVVLEGATRLFAQRRIHWVNCEVRTVPGNRAGIALEAEIDALLSHFGFRKVHSYAHDRSGTHHDNIYCLLAD